MQLKAYCPYDVGDFYITGNAGNPSSKWPGTAWEAVRGKFLLAEDDSHSAGSTGGSETHSHTTGNCTLTADQIPSHTHTYDKSSATSGSTTLTAAQSGVPAHSHGLNSHTHTYAKPNTPTGGTSITVTQLASHTHQLLSYDTSGVLGWPQSTKVSDFGCAWQQSGPYCKELKVTQSNGSGSTHTHTIGTTSTNTGGASGSTANNTAANATSGHTHSITLTSTNSGAAGGVYSQQHAPVQGRRCVGANRLKKAA